MIRHSLPLGTRAFEVRWCVNVPENEFGDSDIDRAKYRRAICDTLEAARTKAKAVFTEAVLGYVEITEIEVVDPFDDGIPATFRWEYVGDSEFYEGEESAAGT